MATSVSSEAIPSKWKPEMSAALWDPAPWTQLRCTGIPDHRNCEVKNICFKMLYFWVMC